MVGMEKGGEGEGKRGGEGRGGSTHLNGPDARSGPQVKHALRVVPDRRIVQLPFAAQRQAVVEKVETVVFILVVGEVVRSILEGMVSTAVLVLVARDAGLQGRGDGLRGLCIGGVVVVCADL